MNSIARRAWSRTSPRSGTTSSAPRSAQGGEIGAAASVSPISRENAMTRNRFRLIGQVGAVLAVLLVALAAGLIAACDGGDSAVAPAPAPPPAPTPAPAPAPEPEPAPPPLDPAAGGVTAIPAGDFIRTPGNFFDLEGKTLTFSPDASGAYTVEVGRLLWDAPGSGGAGTRSRELRDDRDDDAVVNLPFSFPFAGRTWTRVYANGFGNISFRQSERRHWTERSTWSDGQMRSVAAALDSRSAAGLEAMIAALWAEYRDWTVFVDSGPARAVFTWRASRGGGYAPLGENLFQARLYPSGTVELSYRSAPERDGIVGLFHGQEGAGDILDALDDPAGDAPDVMDITRVEMLDNGSNMLARITLARNVPQRVPNGTISFRIGLDLGHEVCNVGFEVTTNGWDQRSCSSEPHVVGFRVRGATIEIWISKTLLDGVEEFGWEAGAYWWDGDGRERVDPGVVRVDEPDRDLGATSGTVAGNVFEVFHYPLIPRDPHEALSFIYERAPANDEIAVIFTDFRFDDIHNSGPGTGPLNVAVQGIGDWQADPGRGDRYRSDILLTSMHTIYIGGENWTETGVSAGRSFHNYGRGVNWIAHEAVHRWAAHLDFRNSRSGEIEPLAGDGCRCHWRQYLHTPEMFPVWPGFSNSSNAGASNMGGNVWTDNGDGTFTRNDRNPLPAGLSALDLYVMGMISPDEFPDTYLLTEVQETGDGHTVRATKLPVRVEDIVAAHGPRLPSAEESKKEFKLGFYLLHPDERPLRADLFARAQVVHAATVDFFARATDGRMRVVVATSPAAILTTSTARRNPLDEGGERTPLFFQGGESAHAHSHTCRLPL